MFCGAAFFFSYRLLHDILPACSLCTMYMPWPQSSEEGIESGVTDPWESPRGWQELNTSRREEQPVLLTSVSF